MPAQPLIPVARTPQERAVERALLEAAARGEALLNRRLADKLPRAALRCAHAPWGLGENSSCAARGIRV